MSARSFRHQPRLVWFVLAATALLIACGSASKHKTSAVGPTVPESSKLSVTLSATDVAGLGTVLVNGDGRTMYLLNSEQGGKITCTDANGCTKVWPDTELPRGMTAGIAGNGVQAALLGTARAPSGATYLTYGGWPLYTFSGDAGPGTAKGEGISSFGGTWYAVSPAGAPATPARPPTTTTAAGAVPAPSTTRTTAPTSTTMRRPTSTTAHPTTTAPGTTQPCPYPPC